MDKILIAGSGKTALDIGHFLLERDFEVFWVTGSTEQKSTIDKQLAKFRRRREMFSADIIQPMTGHCYLHGDKQIPGVDVIIETTSEILVKKQQLFKSLQHLTTPKTLLFSNSSSFFPDSIHPNCFGAHFLFPLLLTNLVELIRPAEYSEERFQQSVTFLKKIDIDFIEQDHSNGFLINRLLLPLQAECLKAVRLGTPAPLVDEASRCGIFPIGQLSLMDRIGLDIIHNAAIQYTNYLETEILPAHEEMLQILEDLIKCGKKGKKNRNGLLVGAPLPWGNNQQENHSLTGWETMFAEKLRSRCRYALIRGEISKKELEIVFNRVYHADPVDLDAFLTVEPI